MTIPTIIGTILGTALLLFYQDWRDGKSFFKKNVSIENKMDVLTLHFNHETTGILNKILDKLDDIQINGVRIKK